MPRRTPPERVVVSLFVNGNGASRAIYESVAEISLQLCAVPLTENLWECQAHKDDNSAEKQCNWVLKGRSRKIGQKTYCDELVCRGGMFCESHSSNETTQEAVTRQEMRTENNAASGAVSPVSHVGLIGQPACLIAMGKKSDMERIAKNKSNWEEVLRKCRDAFPSLYDMAIVEPGFDVPEEMYGDLPEYLKRNDFVRCTA